MSDPKQRVAVVYRSKYGSTKRYAEWIAGEVEADLFAGSRIGVKELLPYDTIVFGGGLYAVGILGFSFVKQHFAELRDKRLIVYAVGASPARKDAVEHVMNTNLTGEMREKIHFFMLRGAFDYSKLRMPDRFLMWLMKRRIMRIKPEERDADSKGLLASYEKPVDWTRPKAVRPIIDAVRGVNEV